MRTVAEEAFYNAISRLNTINTIFDGIAGISFTSYVTLLEFTIAAGQSEAVALVLQLSAIEDVAIEEAVRVVAAHLVVITASRYSPVFAELVFNVSAVSVGRIVFVSRAIVSEGMSGFDTVSNLRAVVNLCISTRRTR